jgi:hypothetical protein
LEEEAQAGEDRMRRKDGQGEALAARDRSPSHAMAEWAEAHSIGPVAEPGLAVEDRTVPVEGHMDMVDTEGILTLHRLVCVPGAGIRSSLTNPRPCRLNLPLTKKFNLPTTGQMRLLSVE